MTPKNCQNEILFFSEKFIFRSNSSFRAEIHTEIGILRSETIPKYLNNSKTTLKKSIKRPSWPQNCQKSPLKNAKMCKILIFWVIYRAFELKIKLKVVLLMPQNKLKILHKQLLNNVVKVKKKTFWIPKIAESRVSKGQKVSMFMSIFDLRTLFLAFF